MSDSRKDKTRSALSGLTASEHKKAWNAALAMAAVSLARQSNADPHLRALADFPPDAPQPPSRLASVEEHQRYLQVLDAMTDSVPVRAMREETLRNMHFREDVDRELRRLDEASAGQTVRQDECTQTKPQRTAMRQRDGLLLPKPWRMILVSVAVTAVIAGFAAATLSRPPWLITLLFCTAAVLTMLGGNHRWSLKKDWGIWLLLIALFTAPLWRNSFIAFVNKIVGP